MYDNHQDPSTTKDFLVGTEAVVVSSASLENATSILPTSLSTTTNKVVVHHPSTTATEINNMNSSLLKDPQSLSSKIYYQDSQLLIRQYKEADDAPSVQSLFEVAQSSLIPLAYRQFLTTSWFGVGTLGSAVAIYTVLMQLVNGLVVSNHFGNGLLWWANGFPSAAALAFVMYALDGLKRDTQLSFDRFRKYTLRTDLPKIPFIYLEGGNKGNFMVAIDKSSGKVVGMVGAVRHESLPSQYQLLPGAAKKMESSNNSSTHTTRTPTTTPSSSEKATTDQKNGEQNEDKNDSGTSNIGVYELRRMAVDPKFQGRSIGKKLVAALEANLWEQHCQNVWNDTKGGNEPTETTRTSLQIFLTCTNIQLPAHRLYEKAGFIRTQSLRPPDFSTGWLKWTRLGIYRYEKLRTGSLQSSSSSSSTSSSSSS